MVPTYGKAQVLATTSAGPASSGTDSATRRCCSSSRLRITHAKMYLVASTVNSSNFRGNEPANYTGAVVYRLASEAPECLGNANCSEGYECVEGVCVPVVVDNPPAITAGPYLAAGSWPLLPTSAESAFELDVNYDVLWTFSDDFASCSGACTHVAEYQAVGGSSWTALPVTVNVAKGRVRVTLPVGSLPNGTYAFRFAVTDCAGHRPPRPARTISRWCALMPRR